MENFEDAVLRLEQEQVDIFEWIDTEYQMNFSRFFEIPEKLSKKLKTNKITDDELSEIMINLPLDLMDASEEVSNCKIANEVTKDSTKRYKLELSKIKDKTSDEYMELSYKILNNDLFMNLETVLVERAEKQITMCKELIMSSKKIWDARRKTEQVMPINEVVKEDMMSKPKPQLGEYQG